MSDLASALSVVAGQAFEKIGLEAKLGQVRRADRPDLADFQCNGAMAAAKAAKRNPREVAGEIAPLLEAHGEIESVDIAGPGFLNIKLTGDALAQRATTVLNDPKAGGGQVDAPRRVMFDFGGWNVAKPMHIGHLRSTIIGDSLQRLFRFLGDDVTTDVHLGDWGLQMGLLITEVQFEQPDLPYFDEDFSGPYPDKSPVTMEDLERLYPQASAKSKEDEARREAARHATAELQDGRPGYIALWKHFCDVTQVGLERECKDLGVEFDLWKGESDAEPLIPDMVATLKEKGVAELDDGAWIIKVERDDDKKDMPPFMLVNSQGASGYHATDLGTILDRVQSNDPELILYVVDQRQALHFEQVFRAARKCASIPAKAHLEHIGFGTVNGKDGKPLKTRDGGVVRLRSLIEDAITEARKVVLEAGMDEKFGADELEDIATKVGIAAIKFADLSNQRMSNYVFDLERFTKFEGKTGPYQMYAAVRIKSMLRKAKEQGLEEGPLTLSADAERNLLLALSQLPEATLAAAEKNAPHILCDHVYTLTQEFNSFYHDCHVLGEKDEAIRASRLTLCAVTLRQIETVLDLLGIDVPERM